MKNDISNINDVEEIEETDQVYSLPKNSPFGLQKTKGKEYTEKQLKFLDELTDPENAGNIRRAMELAGYHKSTSITSVVSVLKDEIIERTKLLLALNAPKATSRLVNVLDDPTMLGAKNVVSASKEILDRVGVSKPASIEINTTDTGGIFILPPKTSNPIKSVN